jgi:hypothetical protein
MRLNCVRIARLALVIVAWMVASPEAHADARVGLALTGRGAAPVRAALERGLAARGLIVVEASPTEDPATQAGALELSALVLGAVDAQGRRWRAELRILDRAGREHARVERSVARGREEELVGALADALPAMTATPEAPAPSVREAAPPEAPPAPSPTVADREPSATVDTPSTPLVTALVQVGAGLRSRAIELVSPDGADAAYRAEPYAELVIRAEARFVNIAFVRAAFGTSAGLRSEREDPRLGEVDTWFAWAQGDAGAVISLGEVELGAAFGAGWDRYGLGFNELVPTAEYVHLRPAALLGVRLIGPALVLQAEGAVRIPFGVGDLASVHGIEHDVIGADGLVRLQGTIDPGFTWAVEFGARRYWLTFARPTGEARGTDGGWHTTLWAGWSI